MAFAVNNLIVNTMEDARAIESVYFRDGIIVAIEEV